MWCLVKVRRQDSGAGGAKRPLYAVCGWMLELWNEKLMFGYLQLSLTSLHQRQIMPIISQLHSPNTNNAPGSQAVARSQHRCIIFSPFLKGNESASMTRKSTAVFLQCPLIVVYHLWYLLQWQYWPFISKSTSYRK